MAATRYARTAKGHDEIAQGRKNLRGKLRTVLFLIDPAKSAEAIRAQIAQLGAPDDAIEQLIRDGYVVEGGAAVPAPAAAPGAAAAPGVAALPVAGDALDEAQQFRVAKAFMNDTIVETLGIRAFMFTLRLEKCATRGDLATLVPDFTEALLKKMERNAVRAIVERTREMLGMAPR